MVTAFDVNQQHLVKAVADDLKAKINIPAWAHFVKTGSHTERQPQGKDWFYMRAAAVLRKVYMDGVVGTERLRTYFGGRKNRGVRPTHFRPAGGKIIRTVLQQLEGLKLVKKGKNNIGREITAEGRKYLDNIAHKIKKA